MANPNIVNVTAIYGSTAVANVTTTSATVVENAAASGAVVKINAILVSNTQNVTETVDIGIERSSVKYHVVKGVSVPAGTTLDALNKNLYLNEGDLVFASCSANSVMQIICSYEVIS